jgi:hypothetical protein
MAMCLSSPSLVVGITPGLYLGSRRTPGAG